MSKQVFIIAEAGVNHNGCLNMAKQLIDVAAQAGADAIKFQTFSTDSLVSKDAPKADYQQASCAKETQYDMLKRLELDERMHEILIQYCEIKGIRFLSTPFDYESLDLLVKRFGLPIIKVPSGEITNAPFLLRTARKGKDIILSTGMSTLGEIEKALGVLAYGYTNNSGIPSIAAFEEAYASQFGQEVIKQKVTLLHCTTEYPAPLDEVNLKVIDTLREAFGLRVGYSDHTEGIAVSIAAVARGATIIEKHFTLDRNLPGPDHKASLEPNELRELVRSIRQVETALGSRIKTPSKSEIKNKLIARKSIVASRDIAEGENFSEDNLTFKRPGDGMSPFYYWELLNGKAAQNYRRDDKVLLR